MCIISVSMKKDIGLFSRVADILLHLFCMAYCENILKNSKLFNFFLYLHRCDTTYGYIPLSLSYVPTLYNIYYTHIIFIIELYACNLQSHNKIVYGSIIYSIIE